MAIRTQQEPSQTAARNAAVDRDSDVAPPPPPPSVEDPRLIELHRVADDIQLADWAAAEQKEMDELSTLIEQARIRSSNSSPNTGLATYTSLAPAPASNAPLLPPPVVQQPYQPHPLHPHIPGWPQQQHGGEAQIPNSFEPLHSFLHRQGNNPRLHSLIRAFPNLDQKHVWVIYRGTFDVKKLGELCDIHSRRHTLEEKNPVSETRGIKELLRCFENYVQIICFFATDSVALSLQAALSDFPRCAMDLADIYTFASVKEFLHLFVYARIHEGPGLLIEW